jgi:hypothetical protein
MKKVLLFSFTLISALAFSQDRFIKTDVSIGSAFTTGKLKSYGISAGVEPKFFFNPHVSLGLRFEGDVLFGGKISGASSDVDVQMSSRAATLLKGEYYLGEGDTRLFVGLMAGMYTQANIGAGSSGSASVGASRNFGFAPELGVTFGNFRLSGMYHIVAGNELVSINVGETATISHSYFVVTLGFKAFQIDL